MNSHPLHRTVSSLQMPHRTPVHGGTRALVVAHRGAWGPAPQNSLAAFEQAIADGADAIELDVRRSADGRLVVVHDPRVGIHAVGKLDHAELRDRLPAGQAPRLEEVLELVAGRIAVDVELKETGYVEQAMAVVTRYLEPDRFVVTSFREPVLPEVRRAVPEARTGLLLVSRPRARELERRVVRARVDFIAPHVALARTGLLGWASARGMPAWVWTVNDPRTIRALLADPRVGAVITDRARDAARAAAMLAADARRAAA